MLELKTVDLCLSSSIGSDAELVADYLNSCPVLYVAAGLDKDPFFGDKFTVPIGCASDGVFVWPLAVEYFVSQYGVGVDQNLLSHIRNSRYVAPKLTGEEVDVLRTLL